MSEGIREVAHAAIEAISRMDVARLIELTDPEVEWHSLFAQVGEGGVYRGHEGMRHYVDDLRESWEAYGVTLEDDFAVGNVMLLLTRLRFQGKSSGVDADVLAGAVARFRGGRIVYMRSFRDPAKALEALGTG